MNKSVRVRFAPSPTGPLHIGGVRTALYNYLFAKKMGGTFILRIEDTDRTRFVEGAEQYIIDTLKWCNILPEEGQSFGGEYGPYRQSDRKELYQKYVQQLIDDNRAYYAFDTPEELDEMREAALAKGQVAKYDYSIRGEMKNSLSMPADEVKKLLDNKTPYVVRLKVMPDETIIFDDIIREQVRFSSNEIDDKVLLKSDGLPTYHMANIVDDHYMKISHVIRGEEWLPSTPLHVLLYKYLGWEDTMPKFAHLPLLLKPSPESYIDKTTLIPLAEKMTEEFFKNNDEVSIDYKETALAFVKQTFQDKKNIGAKLKDRKKDKDDKKALKAFLKSSLFGKLSKRDGDRLGFPVFPLDWENVKTGATAMGFREKGFLPEATINFLAFLGWNPGTEQEIFSLEGLVEAFSLDRVSKSGAKFNYAKSKWFNQQYIINSSNEDLGKIFRKDIEQNGHSVDNDTLNTICDMYKERLERINQFWDQAYYLFEPVRAYDSKTVQKKWKAEKRHDFEGLLATVEAVEDFQADKMEEAVKAYINDNELKFGDILPILRVGLTGEMKGPSVFEVAALLGKIEVVERLKNAYIIFDKM